jgi:hypothetical protein
LEEDMAAEWREATNIRASRWQAHWPEPTRLQEASPASAGYDPDESLSASQMGSRYVRRLSRDQDRDLDPLTQSRALEIAYWLSETNPLAKRILELTTDFVVGSGVEVSSDDEAQKQVIDRFWRDPINRWDLKLAQRVYELGLYGEQCWSVAVNPVDGAVRLGYIDPGVIKEVVHDGEEPREVILVAKAGEESRRLAVVRVDADPQSKWHGRLIVPEGQDGCFFFAINKVSNATRGRSDLLCLADWVDAYDQILFNELDRAILLKSFIWDVTLQGADDKAIQAYIKNNAAPKPGSYRVHNEQVAYQAVTPDLKAADAQVGADLILSYISMGAGHPKTWLSGTMDVNRATAAELNEPAIKRIERRQQFVHYVIEHVLTFALDQAEIAGRLPKRGGWYGSSTPEPWPITVTLPAVRTRDLKGAADTLAAATTALVSARADGAIDAEVEQQVLATLIGQLGIDVDLEAMRERIAVEKAEREEKAAEIGARMWQGKKGEQADEEQDDEGSNRDSMAEAMRQMNAAADAQLGLRALAARRLIESENKKSTSGPPEPSDHIIRDC